MNTNPEQILFSNLSEGEARLRRRIDALAAGRMDAGSLERFLDLVSEAVSILSPFLEKWEGGWFSAAEEEGILRVILSSPLFLPESSLALPKLESNGESGVLAALRRCLYETAAFAALPDDTSALSDGLFRFGVLKGTGYYWSLADHRNRLQYGERPRTFDEFAHITPTRAENALKNIKLVYDNNELELALCLRLPQEAD